MIALRRPHEQDEMDMIQTRYCRKHGRVKAGWYCSTCAADLCPDCVATHTVGHRQAPMDLCCECRRLVAPLTIHRSELIPFWHRVLEAPKYPLGAVGLLSLAGLAFVRALASYLGLMSVLTMGAAVFLLRQGLYWAFIFFIIKDSAQGASKMGVLGLRDIQSDVVMPALKGLLSTALVWLPAAIYVAAVGDGGVLGVVTYQGSKDPFFWLLAIAGILYAPMALLAGATDLGFGQILNPVRIFSFIRRMGRDYFTAIGSVAVVLVAGRMVSYGLGAVLASVGLPFLPRWAAEAVALYPVFIAARVLGLLLFTRGEALDWGRTEEYQVPILAGVRPRGTLKEKPAGREKAVAAAPLPAVSVTPAKQEPRSIPVFDPQVGPLSSSETDAGDLEPRIELEPRTEPRIELAARREAVGTPAAVNLPVGQQAAAPSPPVRPAALDGTSALLLRAVDESRMDEALGLYRELPGHDDAIPAHVHVAVGRQASKARDFDVAVYAFRQVAFTGSEHAGVALVSLAQVVGEVQRDVAAAEKLYREAIKRFPGSQAAAFAERKLAVAKA
jgi:hypothetical protein